MGIAEDLASVPEADSRSPFLPQGRRDWHALSIERAEAELATDIGRGLQDPEVIKRQAVVGQNTVSVGQRRSLWSLLSRQFKDPLTIILIVAVAVSIGVGEHLDAAAIAIIVVLNGLLGFAQEWRADQAIEALRAMLSPQARVRRNGSSVEVDVASLVPGDVVEIKAGDQIPADLRIVQSARLMINEAALTGESQAIEKTVEPGRLDVPMAERSSVAYFGTDVIAGWGVGLVTGIGANTEFGSIVELTKQAGAGSAEQLSPLQQSLAALGSRLGQAAIAIAAGTVLLGILVGRPASEMFLTGVSLAVAIVPEGLPAVVTVTLAIGLRAMSRRNALLRHLEAAETLGAASVICTDKTGTLTQNRMAVRQLWTSAGLESVGFGPTSPLTPQVAQLLETAQHCNHAVLGVSGDQVEVVGDPTEAALLVLARDLNGPKPDGEVVSEIPFDSSARLMTIVVRHSDQRQEAHVKGAPEVVLDRCSTIATTKGVERLDDRVRSEFLDMQEQMATDGLRTLALARRLLAPGDDVFDHELTLLGLVGMHDPPRPEVPEAVARARSAGLDVVVMTGDAGKTALAIANEIGLPAVDVLTGSQLESLDDDALLPFLDGSRVLARVSPEHKMRVVELLQRNGAVVAMTGDGVNDAPALEQASIGIAMGKRGTDVAKGAADLVLVDDNFASIVAAIEEGRRQYANIRKFISYLLSSNLGEVIAVSGSVALGWPLVLIPAQILWMNLMTDGVTALALGVEPVEPDAMERPPRKLEDSIVGRAGIGWILACGIFIGVVTLFVFRLALGTGQGFDLIRAQTLAFTAMVLLETLNVLNFRSERQSFFSLGLLSNRWLLVSWFAAIGAQIAAVHVPGLSDALGTTGLTVMEWLWLAALAIPIFLGGELAKLAMRRPSNPVL